MLINTNNFNGLMIHGWDGKIYALKYYLREVWFQNKSKIRK
jgi:hypothetical protein